MIDHNDYAARIRAACTAPPLAPIRFAEPFATMTDGYAIQTLNRDHWVRSSRQIVGAKIGLTSTAVQQQLGVDQPDFGALFADMTVSEQDGVPTGRLLQPKVEAEIAFVLSRDIDADDENPASLADAIAYALPALEIVGSRIADWDIKMIDTIADNASAGLFVLGTQPVDIRSLDLATCTMQLEKNGTLASEGSDDHFQAHIEGVGRIGFRFVPYPNVPLRGPRWPNRYAPTLRIRISSAPSVIR